jgi:hypothetical protein
MNKLSLQLFLSAALVVSSFQANAQLGNLVKDIKGMADSAEKKLAPAPAPAANPAPAAAPSAPVAAPTASKNNPANSYPAELQGKWAYTAKDCSFPSLEIDKQYATMGTEQNCQLKSMKEKDGKFLISEVCSGEGGSATENTTYSVSGNGLTRSYRKFSDKYVRCGAPAAPAAAKANNDSAGAQKCTVNPGQAGVTTFLDESLKRNGRTIRDFDGYTFVAEKKIKVNKTDTLVGKLLNSNGSVAEAKSYAYADEWTCK